MRSFASDNNSGVHPEVMAAIIEANRDHAAGYGDDRWTERFKETQNILFQYFTFFIEEHRTFSSFLVCQNNLIGLTAILCRFHRRFLDG